MSISITVLILVALVILAYQSTKETRSLGIDTIILTIIIIALADDRSLRLTWRKYLGSACTKEFKAVQQENMELKQQLELMKMCGKVNKNPTLRNNPNFKLLVSKCSGIVIPDDKIIKPDGSYWDTIKDDYKKENPDVKLMGDKFIGPKDEQ
jgi:hypothetical protein